MTKQKLINASGKILVNRNVETVFDFFANPGNDSLWRTEINKSILEGPLKAGALVSEYSNLSKKASNNLLELRCVKFEQNRIVVLETISNARFYLKSERMVKAISENTTEIKYKLEFDKSIVKFAIGFSLPDFIISFKTGNDMQKYLRQLKNQLESK